MYKEKYLKYKIKYIHLLDKLKFEQNNLSYKQTGGSNKFIIKYSNISKEEFNDLYENYDSYQKTFIESFIESCDEIEICLKQIKESRKLDNLYVLCPGDSPFKFVAYFTILEKCKFCKFISFPFSRPEKYNEKNTSDYSNKFTQSNFTNIFIMDSTFDYLDKFIPSDFTNIVIMDSIWKGDTINIIINSMEKKNNLEKNNDIKKNNEIIINDIKQELIYKLENIIKNKYIINLYNFIKLELEEILFVSEKENLRCLESHKDHSNNINIKKYENIIDLILNYNSNEFKKYTSEDDDLQVNFQFGDDLYNSNCLEWIRAVCVAKLNWKWFIKLKMNNNNSNNNSNLSYFKNKPYWFVDLINKYQ